MNSYAESLSALLADYSLRLRPGDLFRIRGDLAALPLIDAVYRRAVERGAHPFVQPRHPEWERSLLKQSRDNALDYISPIEAETVERIDADLVVLAETDPYALAGIDPARIARREKARAGIIHRWTERTGLGANGGIRWCAVLWPTTAFAAQARLSLADFTRQWAQALFLDQPDPIAAWEKQAGAQKRIADLLVERETIRVVAPGTDITFSTRGRGWYNSAGRLNLPDGEVATSPVEDSANGVITFTFPTLWQGQDIDGIKLRFEQGRVVDLEATVGVDALRQMLAIDEGASRLGEFAIGMNAGLTGTFRHPLLDEKIGGTCHFALGNCLPGVGATNRSALHWDLVVDLRQAGTILADGERIYEKGQFIGSFAAPVERYPFWKRSGS